jgi:hypothetical protein
MLINKPDDKKHNILVFNDHEKKFIFNSYKNAKKSDSQTVAITEPKLIKRIAAYLKTNKDNTYLLEREGEPLDKDDVVRVLTQELAGPYKMPSTIWRMRHLYSTFVTVDEPVDPRMLAGIAYKMGTSDTMMIRNYSDFKKKVDTNTD